MLLAQFAGNVTQTCMGGGRWYEQACGPRGAELLSHEAWLAGGYTAGYAQLDSRIVDSFAATLLTSAGLRDADVAFESKFVKSHDSVYRAVALGKYAAGGGIMRTFRSVAPEVREQLEVLWETPGYTPHAFAVHERVPAALRDAVLRALTSLSGDDEGRARLEPLKIPAIEAANNEDWDDVRALNIQDR